MQSASGEMEKIINQSNLSQLNDLEKVINKNTVEFIDIWGKYK
jgi:hypothetical protein